MNTEQLTDDQKWKLAYDLVLDNVKESLAESDEDDEYQYWDTIKDEISACTSRSRFLKLIKEEQLYDDVEHLI